MFAGLIAFAATLLLTVGIVVLSIFLFRRTSNKVMESTKFKYLRVSGADGEANILKLTDTGKTLAGVYCTYVAEIEITSLTPHVKTQTEATFLKSQIPAVGSVVKVKYDPTDPRVAKVVI